MNTQNQTNQLKVFKDELKEWLKVNKLNAAWLALNLNKTEGSVKNWLYNPTLNITEENQAEIYELQERHSQQDASVKYISKKKTERLALYRFADSDYTDKAMEYFPCMIRSSGVMFSADVTFREFSFDFDETIKLATWVTSTIMDAARETIKKEMAKLGDRFKISNYTRDQRGGVDYKAINNMWGMDGEYHPEYCSDFAVPVLARLWDAYYLEIASSIDGYLTTEQYIVEHLGKETNKNEQANLEAFLNNDYSIIDDSDEQSNDYQ